MKQNGIYKLALSLSKLVVFSITSGISLGHAYANGSGFIISQQGHVLTSYHVVANCFQLQARINGKNHPLLFRAGDARNDLALLQIHSAAIRKHAIAEFRAGPALRPGDDVVVVGFPLPGILASQANITTGTISANAGPGDDPRFLQLTAPTQPGNSGGPVLDRSGHVTSMIFAKLDAMAMASAYGDIPQNINFAIKREVILRFLAQHQLAIFMAHSNTIRNPADIGEAAKKFTLMLHCLNSGHQAYNNHRTGVTLGEARIRVPSITPPLKRHFKHSEQPHNKTHFSSAPPQTGDQWLSISQITSRPTLSESLPTIDDSIIDKSARKLERNHRILSRIPSDQETSQKVKSNAKPIKSCAQAAKDWMIQVGAFGNAAKADRAVVIALAQLPDLLHGSESLILPTKAEKGTLYRARLGGFDQQEAKKACSKLHITKLACIPIPSAQSPTC